MPLTLTLSGITDTQQADASDVVIPFNQVKTFVDGLETSINTNAMSLSTEAANRAAADTALVDGVTAFNQLNLGGFGSTLTINSDAITITRTRHVIDTQGGGAADDLSAINGFVVGDLLFLQTTSAARVVTIKHNVGNIFIFTEADIVLDDPSKIAAFLYDTVTGKWCSAGNTQPALSLRESLLTTPVAAATLTVPDRSLVQGGYGAPRLDYVPGINTSHRVTVRASGASIQADMAVITVSGVASAANQTESSYSQIRSGAVLGSPTGWVSTFDLLQRQHNPTMEIIVRSAASFAVARWWIGFMSAAPGNLDDPAGAFIGLRYSTVAGDTDWKIVLDDGSAASVHGVNLAPYNDSTPYLFRIRVDGGGGGMAYFSVNNGPEIAVNTGMPGAATNMGFGCIAYTNAAVLKDILFRSAMITWA